MKVVCRCGMKKKETNGGGEVAVYICLNLKLGRSLAGVGPLTVDRFGTLVSCDLCPV